MKIIKTILFICFLFIINISFADEHYIKVKIDKIISQLQKKYSVSFVYDSIPTASWKEVTYTKVKTKSDYKELLLYLKLFSDEFNKYPTEFINKTKLKHIAFVRFLKYGEQQRNALPDAYKEILFFDIIKGWHKDLYVGRKTKFYMRHVIHHEFYHMIEQEINGSPYYKDSIWNSFNDINNQYGNGGVTMYADMTKKHKIKLIHSKPYKITHPKKGIITVYSGSALEEDKAEVCASLFIKREIRKVKRCIKKDDIILKKVNYMKQFIFKLCNEMNENYWKTL